MRSRLATQSRRVQNRPGRRRSNRVGSGSAGSGIQTAKCEPAPRLFGKNQFCKGPELAGRAIHAHGINKSRWRSALQCFHDYDKPRGARVARLPPRPPAYVEPASGQCRTPRPPLDAMPIFATVRGLFPVPRQAHTLIRRFETTTNVPRWTFAPTPAICQRGFAKTGVQRLQAVPHPRFGAGCDPDPDNLDQRRPVERRTITVAAVPRIPIPPTTSPAYSNGSISFKSPTANIASPISVIAHKMLSVLRDIGIAPPGPAKLMSSTPL